MLFLPSRQFLHYIFLTYGYGHMRYKLNNSITQSFSSYRRFAQHILFISAKKLPTPKMQYGIFVPLVLCISLVCGFEDCGSEVGSVTSLSISGCQNEETCILKRNHNVSISIAFKSNVAATQIKSVVHGVILSVPVPFSLPNSDGCKDSGIACPISADQAYTYTSTLPVLGSYPKVSVDVKWELRDQDGKDLACVLIPSKIN